MIKFFRRYNPGLLDQEVIRMQANLLEKKEMLIETLKELAELRAEIMQMRQEHIDRLYDVIDGKDAIIDELLNQSDLDRFCAEVDAYLASKEGG